MAQHVTSTASALRSQAAALHREAAQLTAMARDLDALADDLERSGPVLTSSGSTMTLAQVCQATGLGRKVVTKMLDTGVLTEVDTPSRNRHVSTASFVRWQQGVGA